MELPAKYIIYAIEGFLMALFNFLIVAAVLRSSAVRQRKEFLVIAGLAFADMLTGLAFLSASIYRSHIHITGQSRALLSSWECAQKLHSILFIFGAQTAALMLTCVSIDRLNAVISPLKYFKFGAKYARTMVGILYGAGFLGGISMLVASYFEPRVARYPATCLTWNAVGHPILRQYYFFVRVLGGGMSVLLFLLVPLFSKRAARKMLARNASVRGIRARQQRKLVKTVGISVFFTAVFYVFPNIVRTLFANSALVESLGEYTSCIQNINALMNLFVLLRHAEIKNALYSLLICADVGPRVSVVHLPIAAIPTVSLLAFRQPPTRRDAIPDVVL